MKVYVDTKKLRHMCIDHNIKLTKMLTLVGLATSTCNSWDKGVEPKLSAVLKIAHFFDIGFHELLVIEDYSSQQVQYEVHQKTSH